MLAQKMITTAETLTGYDIASMLGPVEGIVEKGFSAVSVEGFGIVRGGGLDQLVQNAKDLVARAAAERGADAVVALRYVVSGRELEKSVVAYGTAVKCKKL